VVGKRSREFVTMPQLIAVEHASADKFRFARPLSKHSLGVASIRCAR
jgi:hypothetical protein